MSCLPGQESSRRSREKERADEWSAERSRGREPRLDCEPGWVEQSLCKALARVSCERVGVSWPTCSPSTCRSRLSLGSTASQCEPSPTAQECSEESLYVACSSIPRIHATPTPPALSRQDYLLALSRAVRCAAGMRVHETSACNMYNPSPRRITLIKNSPRTTAQRTTDARRPPVTSCRRPWHVDKSARCS